MFLTTYIKDIESSCLDYSVRQDWFSVTLGLEVLSALILCIWTAGAIKPCCSEWKTTFAYAQGFKLYFDTRQTKGFQAYILDYSEHVAFST